MNVAIRLSVTVGVALVGAGVIAVTPVTAPPPAIEVPDIQLTAGEQDIVIDFVRHAQTEPSSATVAIASQGLPGFPLSQTGETQAADIGSQLAGKFPDGVAGVYGGYEQRMIETAMPFLHDEGLTAQDFQPMDGFDEIGGGIYAQAPPSSPGDILYELTVAAWALGFQFVPLPGSNDFNGMQFEENVNSAIADMYSHTATDQQPATDVVFSGGAMISTWTLMNVNNPDVAIFIPLLLSTLTSGNANGFISNASITEVTGNPEDGWTLVSFDGQPIPADPGLLTELIVDLRNVLVAPQTAVYNLMEAAITGNTTAIEKSLESGLENIGAALTQFPGSVVNDIATEVQNLGAAVAGGESFSDAFESTILGLT